MADVASWKCIVVWADELRVASKAISALYETLRNKEASEDARIVATKQALESCYAALKGIDDDASIVVCEASAGKFVPRVTEVVKK